MATGTPSLKSYEFWNEVDPNEERIRIIGGGEWVHNKEMEAYFSKLFVGGVQAVFTHALMSNAKTLPEGGVEFFNESFYIFTTTGEVVRIAAALDLTITSTRDKNF